MTLQRRLLIISIAVVATMLVPTVQAWAAPRNVIVLIGDGMGPQEVKAASLYAGAPLSFESFAHQARMTTYAADTAITDSAAAGTAIATGHKVNYTVVSVALPGDGADLTTLLEYLQSGPRRTGLVTTSYMTDATPAVFGAHNASRYEVSQIANDYLTRTRPNVLLGGGGNGLTPADALAAGYAVVTDAAGLSAVDAATATYVSGQFGDGPMPFEYDGLGALPHLSGMTAKALDILDGGPAGFFLMVEGGLIDYAGHSNNLARSIAETLEFGRAAQTVIDWAAGRTDTLILVLADHETGGLTVLADNGAGNYPDVNWASTHHTAANVPVYAWGPGADALAPLIDNTDIFALVAGAPATTEAPEPATMVLLAGGGLTMLAARRRRRGLA